MSSSFEMTEAELLHDRLSHTRFLELLDQRSTLVYTIQEASNAYGEFVFVTMAARLPNMAFGATKRPKRRTVTFWGLGFHESRERWLTHWRWYEAQLFTPPTQAMPKPMVLETINARHALCVTEAAAAEPPSAHARAFSFFADLTDEDGALAPFRKWP